MNRNFNFALVVSIVVLLLFSYITFLGLMYWNEGIFGKPIFYTFALIAVVLLCVLLMRFGRENRVLNMDDKGQKKPWGIIVMVLFGFIILVAFLLAAKPFTNFLRVWHDLEEIGQKVEATYTTAIDMDQAYVHYVNTRIEDYKTQLHHIANNKNENETDYNQCLAGAAGETDNDKIESLANSLHKRLLPDTTMAIVAERQSWLNGVKEVKVLNPMTAANINTIDSLVNCWLDNYRTLSAISYRGEDTQAFDYPDFGNKVKELTSEYTEFKRMSPWAIIVALFCVVCMLAPFLISRTDTAILSDPSKKHGSTIPDDDDLLI